MLLHCVSAKYQINAGTVGLILLELNGLQCLTEMSTPLGQCQVFLRRS